MPKEDEIEWVDESDTFTLDDLLAKGYSRGGEEITRENCPELYGVFDRLAKIAHSITHLKPFPDDWLDLRFRD